MCQGHLLQLQQEQDEVGKLNAVSVALSVEPATKTQPFRKGNDLTYPILSDPKLAATDLYKVRAVDEGFALPALFLVDKKGVIRLGRVGVAHGPFDAGVLTQALDLLRHR